MVYFNHILITLLLLIKMFNKKRKKKERPNFQKLGRSFKSLVIYSILGKCNAGDTSRKPYGTRGRGSFPFTGSSTSSTLSVVVSRRLESFAFSWEGNAAHVLAKCLSSRREQKGKERKKGKTLRSGCTDSPFAEEN